jgi:hypothetical protein
VGTAGIGSAVGAASTVAVELDSGARGVGAGRSATVTGGAGGAVVVGAGGAVVVGAGGAVVVGAGGVVVVVVVGFSSGKHFPSVQFADATPA